MNRITAILGGLSLAIISSVAPALAADAANTVPKGWITAGSAPKEYLFGTEKCGASKCAFIKAKSEAPSGYGTLMQEISTDQYIGKRLRLSALLKTANVRRAQLWMRIDGPQGQLLGFYNMDDRPVTGTTDWKRYSLVLDVPKGAIDIAFGMFLDGKGQVWAEDFKLDPVSKDVPVSNTSLPKAPMNLGFDQ